MDQEHGVCTYRQTANGQQTSRQTDISVNLQTDINVQREGERGQCLYTDKDRRAISVHNHRKTPVST